MLIAVAILLAWPRIPQDPAYHQFADMRSWLGIPNFWNVVTNVPFMLAGGHGLSRLPRLRVSPLRLAYAVFCFGVVLVGFGSGYYHLAPSNATLVWDRGPMTIAFMALFSLVIGDSISMRAGARLLWPLAAAGFASVIYWQLSEMRGAGDLRPYALVQFLPMLLIPLVLMLFGSKRLRSRLLWLALFAYVPAKLAEHYDAAILALTGFVSGHSIKHLLAAAAAWAAILAYAAPAQMSARRLRRSD
ncbi:ceramidase domain-containing protein [soil metagenome]